MENTKLNIVFSSKISDLCEINPSFDQGVLRVCYTGRNRNNTFISKETFERCIQTIFNCPVVCNYDRENQTIGAHDIDMVRGKDGDLSIVNITNPVGVIPESAKFWWENITDPSGMHEYLCVEVLIWKRQDAYDKIKNDGITSESMEISILDGEMIDGVYHIYDFIFTAFCLLGSAEPCFESASLQFSYTDIKLQFELMMEELKQTNSVVTPLIEDDINQQKFPKGGMYMNEKLELLSKYGLTLDTLDFTIEDLSLEELKSKLETLCNNQNSFALAGQFLDELLTVLGLETINTCFGEMRRYHYVDHDAELEEVYCYDMEDDKLYGLKYTINGDSVSIDFESRKRKKFAIVDFDEGEDFATFSTILKEISDKHSIALEEIENKYQSANDDINSLSSEIEILREFKLSVENEATVTARNAVFEKFTQLNGLEEFEALKDKDYSVQELEEKCFAIIGRFNLASKPNSPQPKLVVETPSSTDEYGGLFQKYGINAED